MRPGWWRSGEGRALLVVVLIVVGLALVALLPLVAGPRAAPREILLVARDMTFYVDGGPDANPTIRVAAGEAVRFVLRNEDPGVTHNFAIKAWNVSIGPLKGEEQKAVVVRAPNHPGRDEYVCMPHAKMMKGVLEVTAR